MITRRDWGRAALGAAAAGLLEGCGSPEQAPPGGASAGGDLLARSIVIDLHIDTPGRMVREAIDLGERRPYQNVDIPRMREGGITAGWFAVFTSAGDKTELEAVKAGFEILDMVVREVERHPEDLTLATTADEIVQAKRGGKIAILLGVEGGHMIDSSLAVLRDYYRLGVRYLGLTHSHPTPWASSAESPEGPNGLTDFGREVVRELNRLGMTADLSHASDETFAHTIETSRAPVINSHACCRSLVNNPRNLTDDQLRALAKNGGLIGIAYYAGLLVEDYGKGVDLSGLEAERAEVSQRLKGKPQLSAELERLNKAEAERLGPVPFSNLMDHFEHAASVAGVGHVGFGSDLDAIRRRHPEGMGELSSTPRLASGLRERGFSDSDISKILGGNALRVMREVEKAAEKA